MRQLLLVAMSGVRIVNPALRALGLTLPGFVERGKVIASMPSLGLLTIAGATPPDWAVDYIEIDELQSDWEVVLDNPPELVALSSLSARIDDAYSVAQRFRASGSKVVLGGLHASVLPEEAMAHVDAVVAGQGEWVWPLVVRDFERGELKRFYDGRQTIERLETTPLPRFDLLRPDLYNRIPLQTTRGCPLDCSFCAASRLISPYKRKPIERIREELDAICAIWPEPFVELADDNTFVNKSWGRALAELMMDYPQVKWFTETDVSLGEDGELLSLLSRSGCSQVLIGLESINTQALETTDRGHWKRRQRAFYQERIAAIQDAGISVNGCFIFGFDADTEATFEETAAFIEESGLSEVQLTLLTPFPGTELSRKLAAERRLLRERYWDQCTLFDVVFEPKGFTVAGLEKAFRGLIGEVYSAENSERRRMMRQAIYRKRRKMA